MNRSELTLVIAGALVLALLIGWTLRWMLGRLDAAGPGNAARAADLAARLHDAEDARARAEARLAAVERDLTGRLAQLESELNAALDRLDTAQAQGDAIRAAYRETRDGRPSLLR